MKKRLGVLIVCLVMVMSLLPLSASGEEAIPLQEETTVAETGDTDIDGIDEDYPEDMIPSEEIPDDAIEDEETGTEEEPAMNPPWQEPEPVAAEEEKPAPVYVLTDAQKAVREVVKKKGKDTAKEILARFPHKDKENEPATGASALRPEDYPAAIKALEEALNG